MKILFALVCVLLPRAIAQSLPSQPAATSSNEITVHTDFEAASVGRVERLGPAELRIHIPGQADQSGRNRQANWYFFRVDGVRGRDITLHLIDFVGEYNFKPGACAMNADTFPVFSEDGGHWQHVPSMDWDDQTKEATLHLRMNSDSLWIAHVPPYPLSKLQQLLADLAQSPWARIRVIGHSVQGRDLPLVTVTDPEIAPATKKCVWIIARQHAWETGTSFVLEGALRFLTSDDQQARDLRRRVIFRCIPTMDPDGLALGHVRFNSLGYDLNRHWTEVDPHREDARKLMPEIWSIKRAIVDQLNQHQEIDFLLNLHNTENNEYIETEDGEPSFLAKLRDFDRALGQSTSFDPHRPPVLSASPPDTTNSLWTEMHVPAVLMEQRIGTSPKLHRRLSVADRLAFGRDLVLELGRITQSSPNP